jgi:CubicO group peptidase (beta-lactamase class C family)
MSRGRRTDGASCAVVIVVAAALLAGCASPPPGRTEVGVRPGELREAALLAANSASSDEAIAAKVPAKKPGCSAAVARTGVVLWAGAAGMADLAHKIPDTIETRFDIASISKQFTSAAILMLQREGKLKVSDPIAKYVPGLPAWGSSVSLDELMHHTSRIPDYWVELDKIGIGFSDAADQATTLDAIRRETRLEPGSGFLYSNSNYVLLAEVVRTASGMKLSKFLDERIFTPLGLDMVLAPTLHADDIALSYDDNLNRQEAGWTSYGHTGIITTASELARWGDQYRTGDIIQDDFFDNAVYEAEGEYYAAGMDIEVDGDLNHTGRMGGFVSDFTVSADRETTIVVLCNGHTSDRFGVAKALWAIWGKPPAE